MLRWEGVGRFNGWMDGWMVMIPMRMSYNVWGHEIHDGLGFGLICG
jgi:hypothetical protein